jgi:hypothetical protein
VLVAHRARSDPAASDQPRGRHRNAARDGRARPRPTVGRGRREHAARPTRRQAGLRRPERRVPGPDHRTGADREPASNRPPAGTSRAAAASHRQHRTTPGHAVVRGEFEDDGPCDGQLTPGGSLGSK